MESTKEYQETYWFQTKYEDDTRDLIPLNKFWCEYGEYLLSDDKEANDLMFLSKWILLTTSNINEIICALSVLNLSFKSDGTQYYYDENRLILKCEADGGSVVFVKQLIVDKDENSLITTQNKETISVHVSYFDPLDAYEYGDDGETYDKFILPQKDTFYTLKVYCCLIVLTNVSSMQQSLKMLVEIPSGSIPCGKDSYFNKTHFISIGSYSTQKLKFYFYFPQVDEKKERFYSFPIIVSKHRNNEVVSWTKAQKLNVVSSVKKYDEDEIITKSQWNRWKKISVAGNYDEILSFLSSKQCNLFKMKNTDALERIYYLFQRKDSMQFWHNVVELLWKKKLYFDDVIASFSLKYKANDKIGLKSLFHYLSNKQTFIETYFSPYFYIANDLCIKNEKLPYFEYIPLINSRVHSLGSTTKQIMNYNLRAQYKSFLNFLSYQSLDQFTYFDGNSSGQIILSLIYYFIVQDRIDDALLFYNQFVDKYDDEREQRNNINIDYLKCYLLLFEDEKQNENIKTILNICNKYLSKQSASLFPKKKLQWFYDLNQLLIKQEDDETKRDDDDPYESGQSAMKSKQSSLSFTIDKTKKQLMIHSHLVRKCNINFYGMNTELLFSIDPFTFTSNDADNQNKNAFHYISAGVSLNGINLLNNKHKVVDIPKALLNKNIFIVVDSCDDDIEAVNAVSCSDTFYDHQLIIQIKETYGKIKVISAVNRKPIKRAYIKVFAKMSNDKNEFYKDGYSDIRGGFDYVSVSSAQLQNAQKFAILIVTKECGCAVKYAKKPKT